MLYVGIDVSKHKHDFAILDQDGTIVLKKKQFPNNRGGFTFLHKTLQQLNEPCLIALEDTGRYAFNLLAFLLDMDDQTYTYNPLLIKEFGLSTTLRQTKTDTKDALLIALRVLSDSDRERFRTKDNTQSELKILSRHVSRLTKTQTQTKIQYIRLLDTLLGPLLKLRSLNSYKPYNSFIFYKINLKSLNKK